MLASYCPQSEIQKVMLNGQLCLLAKGIRKYHFYCKEGPTNRGKLDISWWRWWWLRTVLKFSHLLLLLAEDDSSIYSRHNAMEDSKVHRWSHSKWTVADFGPMPSAQNCCWNLWWSRTLYIGMWWGHRLQQQRPSDCVSHVDWCKYIHAQIYTNLGTAPQSVVGILHQMGQETHVVAKCIEKNWEGLFLVGWELVRRKHKSKMHAYYIFEISEEHKIIDT